jgi:hypothetical protein
MICDLKLPFNMWDSNWNENKLTDSIFKFKVIGSANYFKIKN